MMAEDRIEPVSDAQIDAAVERWGREEEDELAKAWGQGILDAARDGLQGRVDEDRALLDAIERASEAVDKGEE